MKAFLAGLAAAIVIAIAAGVILDNVQMSTADTYSSQNVRLPETK